MGKAHPYARKTFLEAKDFAPETLITYPVPEEMIDLIRLVLTPAGVQPQRRTAELTVAILQLVASRRGIAALPGWSVESYLSRNYVIGKRIGEQGLWSNLYAATRDSMARLSYMQDFLDTVKQTSFGSLEGIVPLTAAVSGETF